ncbi:kinase-like protein [Trametopsis cervina]|nr:kinase-like protein [Trametopsis cervina]
MSEGLLRILILLTGIAILVGTLVPLDEEPCDDSDAGVTLAEYRIGKSLANHEDSLAHVHLAQSVQTGRTCAIKIIQKQKIVDLGQSMYIRRGLQALRAAQSPFVVQYFTAFQDHDHLFVVTDYVSEVSLHHLLQRFTKLSEHIARFYAAELVSAISFLHGHNVVHGALNPRNCLIAASGHIKLCGFTYAYPSASSPQPLCYDKATFHYLQNYIAPEVLRDELVTPPADWYALGAMLYQMLVGWTPKNIDKLARFLSEYSQPVQDVVLSLLSAEPFMRNGIGKLDLRGHTWFSGIDWDEVEGCRLEPLYKPICDEEFDFPSQQIEFPSMEPPLNDSYAGSFPDFKYRPRKFSMAHGTGTTMLTMIAS